MNFPWTARSCLIWSKIAFVFSLIVVVVVDVVFVSIFSYSLFLLSLANWLSCYQEYPTPRSWTLAFWGHILSGLPSLSLGLQAILFYLCFRRISRLTVMAHNDMSLIVLCT